MKPALSEPAMLLAGADGCKAGWVCITKRDGRIDSVICPTAKSLASQRPSPDVLAVDIPIGLTDVGARICDWLARRMLGARGCCVFTAPIRPLLAATSYQEASAIRFEVEGKRLSKQAWEIVAKIREIDDLLRRAPELQGRILEVHPEICFMHWNGSVAIAHRKRSLAGRELRTKLVAEHFGSSAFETVRRRYPRSQVADDDINDAFAALWSAEHIAAGIARRIPEDPPRDRYGLRMQMVW